MHVCARRRACVRVRACLSACPCVCVCCVCVSISGYTVGAYVTSGAGRVVDRAGAMPNVIWRRTVSLIRPTVDVARRKGYTVGAHVTSGAGRVMD